MRSLYTDDIPGAHPRLRHYEKKLFRGDVLPQPQTSLAASYFGSQPYQPYYYSMDQQQSSSQLIQKRNLPSLDASYNRLANSMQLSNNNTDPNVINWSKVRLDSGQTRLQSQEKKKRVNPFSDIGRRSLVLESNQQKMISQPYFPHCFNGPKDHNMNKLTGNRDWNPEKVTEVIYIPKYRKVPDNE